MLDQSKRFYIKKWQRSIVGLVLIVAAACNLWIDEESKQYGALYDDTEFVENHHWQNKRQLEQQLPLDEEDTYIEPETITVCGRNADTITGSSSTTSSTASAAPQPILKKEYTTYCPPFDPKVPTLLIEGNGKKNTYGRTGNQIIEFLSAIQLTRDRHIQLGITYDSWAMDTITKMFMVRSNNIDEWKSYMESQLCIKLFRSAHSMHQEGYVRYSTGRRQNVQKRLAEYLFGYYFGSVNDDNVEEIYSRHFHVIRTLFQNVNTGLAWSRDVCSGINSLFATAAIDGSDKEETQDKDDEGDEGGGHVVDPRSTAKYTLVHHRHLENMGEQFLGAISKHTGCDPRAALHMPADYIKSILLPIDDMLNNPIVVVTDGQDNGGLKRLLDDPDIGHLIRLVPKEDSWLGGDVTLGVMSTVFIGNPASTISLFIAKSRIALGLDKHNYLYRAKDENGQWTTVCGVECMFHNRWDPKQLFQKRAPEEGNVTVANE